MESSNCPDHTPLARPYSTNGLNQYESAGNIAFCYDANGNLTATRGPDPQLDSVYLYDAENRLVERRVRGAGNDNCNALSYTGALQAQLLYDPTGRLYQVSGGAAGIQRFAYDGNAMIAEYNAAGTMLRRYVHGSNAEADDPLIWYEGATQTSTLRRYLHADPRGSVVAVTDHTGNRIATNTYDEYGIPDTATSAANSLATKGRFRYTGQAWIPELGMYYYKARIYSPTLGRFLQTDPIGYEDQVNLYAYANNDPINFIDPSGLEGDEIVVRGRGKQPPPPTNPVIIFAPTHSMPLLSTPQSANLGKIVRELAKQISRPARIIPKFSKKNLLRQMQQRGWTQAQVERVVQGQPIGKTVNRANGNPASVYGKQSEHVIVDDVTKEVIQVSDKLRPWIPDSSITWF